MSPKLGLKLQHEPDDFPDTWPANLDDIPAYRFLHAHRRYREHELSELAKQKEGNGIPIPRAS